MPGRNATGTNTAISTAVVAMMGPVTSPMAAFTASGGVLPPSICRLTFSTTTMASSTTSPMASTRPSRLTVLMENPATFITPSVPMRDTGMETAGIRIARQDWRNTNTTMNTSAIASPRVITTSVSEAETNIVVSYLIW